MIDRTVAVAAGMAAALYIMAAAVAWSRVFVPAPTPSLATRVMPDRAVGWSALSTIFIVMVGVRLGWWSWNGPGVGIVLALASFALFAAGLVSVRAITQQKFGNRALAVFAAVSIATGLLILML
ncbi:MAG TPA: hypothetical protein VK634_06905 [Reyranella sp.]|nr:hypothetical protein [Reyranella sp.]HTE80404.1 hypothetical protein [Reyranella sp.]